MRKKGSAIQKRLNILLLVCLVPLGVLVIYLIVLINRFSERYDEIVENITMANAYNIDFKEDIDYVMYIVVANSERAEELVDTSLPHTMIDEARDVFNKLCEMTDDDNAMSQLQRIIKSLDTLEDRIEDIEADVGVSGAYDKNMEALDLNVRILTDLIQEQIQEYIYYEATNLESLREGIRSDVVQAIRMSVVLFIVICIGAIIINRRIIRSITEPIRNLCDVTKQVGQGDFEVRLQEGSDNELVALNSSFNRMVEHIDNLVEDIRVEQLNLRAMELKLLQAQINPHFLYNTLDAIIWLAESGQDEQVVMMVSALSDFFRTTLSKGKDYISVREEKMHIESYLKIQQFRYRDILEYEICIPEELYQYKVLKLTLQPLVENALYHGIKNRRGMGRICVTGMEENGSLIFYVRDNGIGMKTETLQRVRCMADGDGKEQDSDAGFGLFNVAQRIRLNCGEEYGLTLSSEYGKGTEIRVVMPAVKI